MNINTNTLLNTLMSKVDSTLKAKIEKLSVDGKVDLSIVAKEKGIQTLLSQLFKDISTGTKNKAEVVNLLESSKQSLKFKNISTDLKQIINSIKIELKNNPEVEKLTTLLKTSLLDIKNVDEKILKSTFQNSGVFLESKLGKSNETVSSNLKNLLGQLTDKLKVLSSLDKSIQNTPSETKAQKMPNITSEVKMELASSKMQNILTAAKMEITSQKMPNILTEAKIETTSQKILNMATELKSDNKFQKIVTISNEVKNNVKADVQNILQKIESSQQSPKVEAQLNTLKTVLVDIKNLEQKFVKLDIKNEITVNLKEVVQQVKNNILNTSLQSVNKTIIQIKDQLENIKSNNIAEVKNDVKKLDGKIELLNNEKNIEVKTAVIKDLIQTTTKVVDKINNSNIQELLKNNISNLKNISGDLKTIMLQIKEVVEQPNNSETTSKELKNNVDKVLSQIDYYQLSSYSSNSSHSYVSFLQDDIEDMDIKFNNKNNEEFSCLIHLSLKEKGDLKILLQLDKKSGLNINIGVEQKEFKIMIQDALQKLRVQINSLGLSLLSLNIFDLEDESQKSNELKAYGNNQNLDFGLDIKV